MERKKAIEYMTNIFTENVEITKLNKIPKKIENDESIEMNKIYKIQYTCISVDLIGFTKLNDKFKDDPRTIRKIINPYIHTVTKILQEYNAIRIDIQGDGVIAIFNSEDYTKNINDDVFYCLCELNSFRIIFNQFWKDTKKLDINFGIGAYFSRNNYIIFAGNKSVKDYIFLGDSVNYASKLSKVAGRKKFENNFVLINIGIYNNLEKENQKLTDKKISIFTKNDIHISDNIINYWKD